MQITINVTIITFPVMANRTNLQLNQMANYDSGSDSYNKMNLTAQDEMHCHV